MSRLTIVLFHSLLPLLISGQSVVGLWQSLHPETKLPIAYIEVYEKNHKAYARVIEIVDHSLSKVCDKCEGELKNRELTHMDVILNLKRKSQGHYKKGQIIDPSSGKVYKCFIKLETPDILKVRAYSGLPTFGKTQYWSRLKSLDVASIAE